MQFSDFAPLLVCPACRGQLVLAAETLHCQNPDHTFSVVRGVPVLLPLEELDSLRGDFQKATQMQKEYKAGPAQIAVKMAKRIVGSTLHLPYSPAFLELLKRSESGLRLEIGSGITPSGPRQVNLEIELFQHVDVVASALHIPFQDDTFDLIKNIAVLEHVKFPAKMVDEIRRVLRPGGHVYAEVPFIQHFHAYPNDFQRYTIEGFKVLFKDYRIVETGVCVGPSSALLAAISNWFEIASFARGGWLANLFKLIPLLFLFPMKYLDYLLMRNPRAHELASGIYIIAQKA